MAACMLQFSSMEKLGVYIQVPFCQTKCTYCNFHTGVVSRDRYEPYAAAICREIAGAAETEGRGFNPGAIEPTKLGLSRRLRPDALCREAPAASLLSAAVVDTVYFG